MAMIGEVIQSAVVPDPDGDGHILTLQVQITDPDDIQDIELMRHAGVDYKPPEDSQVVIVEIHPSYRVAIACDDGIEPEAAEGDYEIYGSDSGAKTSRVKCVYDGQVEVNGTGDWAVRYTELKTAFDQLKTDFDALVGVFNNHQHAYVGAGTGSSDQTTTGAQSGSTSSADMTNSKVDTVELPGYEAP